MSNDIEKQLQDLTNIVTNLANVVASQVTTLKPFYFGEWVKEWYKLYKCPILKKSTLIKYDYYISTCIVPNIGQLNINSDDFAVKLQEYLTSIDKGNTRKKVALIINNSLDKAVKLRKINYNPFISIELGSWTKKHYKPLDLYLQDYMLDLIYMEKYKCIYWILCCTGMRVGEFLALDLKKDIDYDKNIIYITKNYDYINKVVTVPKTTTGNRKIIFLNELKPHFDFLIKDISQGINFTYNGITLFFKRLYIKFDLKGYNLHTFRHTFASNCYAVGMREKHIQQLLGHSNIETTLNIYTHTLDSGISQLKSYVKKLNETYFI